MEEDWMVKGRDRLETEITVELEAAIPVLKSIIARERADGCTMAAESLIEPALRRWKSYERRNKKNKHNTLEHRAHDLEKGLLIVCGMGYDRLCIRHLAQSFAEVLYQGKETTRPPRTGH